MQRWRKKSCSCGLWCFEGLMALIYPASMLKLYFVFTLFLLYNSNAKIYYNLVIIKTEMLVFAPTTDVSSSSRLTWHFLLHSIPPFSLYSFPCFSPPLQSEGNDQQKNSALPSVPSLLEVFGFSYFYGGFLVGPQFTLLKYQQLVNRELTDCRGKPPSRSETQSDIAKENEPSKRLLTLCGK